MRRRVVKLGPSVAAVVMPYDPIDYGDDAFGRAFAKTGYLYGEDALEQVRLGWELREKAEAAELQDLRERLARFVCRRCFRATTVDHIKACDDCLYAGAGWKDPTLFARYPRYHAAALSILLRLLSSPRLWVPS